MLRNKRLTTGRIIRKRRKSKKLTQLELADRVGVDRSYIGHIELGERSPTISTLKKIARSLGVRWTVLVD
jgi:transcriptional regulator with XRE-family HTH domain